jgi:hypothetical protein
MAKQADYIRPDCANCGMAMIAIAGFSPLTQEQKIFECLRCGLVDPPATTMPAGRGSQLSNRVAIRQIGGT